MTALECGEQNNQQFAPTNNPEYSIMYRTMSLYKNIVCLLVSVRRANSSVAHLTLMLQINILKVCSSIERFSPNAVVNRRQMQLCIHY
jgi:hypothetical protein